VNWGMVLSHHPPCQFDRTYILFKRRFCIRCTGIAAGVLSSLVLFPFIPLPFLATLIPAFLLPLPAIFNFTLNELGKRKNTFFKRFLTGFLMGISIGISIEYLFSGKFLYGMIIILWIVILEFIVALILHKANILAPFVKEYEDAVYKD
jgi:uncharacterized membrane protein